MINLGMSIFDLAKIKLKNKKKKFTPLDVIDMAIKLRKKFDESEIAKSKNRFRRILLNKMRCLNKRGA